MRDRNRNAEQWICWKTQCTCTGEEERRSFFPTLSINRFCFLTTFWAEINTRDWEKRALVRAPNMEFYLYLTKMEFNLQKMEYDTDPKLEKPESLSNNGSYVLKSIYYLLLLQLSPLAYLHVCVCVPSAHVFLFVSVYIYINAVSFKFSSINRHASKRQTT